MLAGRGISKATRNCGRYDSFNGERARLVLRDVNRVFVVLRVATGRVVALEWEARH